MKVHQFRVRWEIDVWAVNSLDAAEQAGRIQRDKKSIATVFNVSMVNQKTGKIGKPVEIDLLGIDLKKLG
jgi:hypothetical protein